MENRVPPPTKSSQPAVNHLTLFEAFRSAFEYALASIQWPESDKPVLVQEFPKERNGEFDKRFDVILYRLVRSEIASTANDRDRKPKGLSQYFEEPHPTKAGYKRILLGWQEMVMVEFRVLAKSNRRADELVTWFHRTIMLYAHAMKFFQARGVNHLVFVERLEDAMTKDYGQELYVRPLRYALRLELLDVADAKTLEQVSITVNGDSIQ